MKHVAIIVALIVAGAVFWGVGKYAASVKVDRSVEKTFPYDYGKPLRDDTHKYVVPVLFPLDLIAMIVLSASFGWAAATWGPIGLGFSPALFLVLPIAYLGFDLAEDSLLALVLTGVVDVTAGSRTLLTALTAGKLVFFIGALGQVVMTGAAAALRGLAH